MRKIYIGRPCKDCSRVLCRKPKPGGAPPDGRVVHNGYQLCVTCHMTRRRFGTPLDAPGWDDMSQPLVVHGLDDPDPGIRDLAGQLHHLITDRRHRGIPTEGNDV